MYAPKGMQHHISKLYVCSWNYSLQSYPTKFRIAINHAWCTNSAIETKHNKGRGMKQICYIYSRKIHLWCIAFTEIEYTQMSIYGVRILGSLLHAWFNFNESTIYFLVSSARTDWIIVFVADIHPSVFIYMFDLTKTLRVKAGWNLHYISWTWRQRSLLFPSSWRQTIAGNNSDG